MVNMVQSSPWGSADQWLERMHHLGQENRKKVEHIDTDVSLS